MTTEKLTPEEIASIANTLTEEELAELIREYGYQVADESAYWAGKNS